LEEISSPVDSIQLQYFNRDVLSLLNVPEGDLRQPVGFVILVSGYPRQGNLTELCHHLATIDEVWKKVVTDAVIILCKLTDHYPRIAEDFDHLSSGIQK